MTEQNTKIDGRTKRAADMALAKRTISRASYDALLAGRIALHEAKSIGRDGAPAADTGQATDGPGTATGGTERQRGAARTARTRPRSRCRASARPTLGNSAGAAARSSRRQIRRWKPGHDQRAKGIIRRAVKEGKVGELSPQLKEYGKERGLI